MQERAFTRTGRAHDRHEFARLNGEIDTAQRLDPRAARAIGLGHLAGGDNRVGPGFHKRISKGSPLAERVRYTWLKASLAASARNARKWSRRPRCFGRSAS